MDDGPMDHLYYVNLDSPIEQRSNLDRPYGRRSIGPPILRKFLRSRLSFFFAQYAQYSQFAYYAQHTQYAQYAKYLQYA